MLKLKNYNQILCPVASIDAFALFYINFFVLISLNESNSPEAQQTPALFLCEVMDN